MNSFKTKLLFFLSAIIFTCQAQIAERKNTPTYQDIKYGEGTNQNMDIFIPTKSTTQSEYVLVFIHGGGYIGGDKTEDERYIVPFLSKNIPVVNLNYSLRKGIPKASEDIVQALNFLYENDTLYPLRFKKIILSGSSAGGHVASLTGLSRNNTEYPYKLNDSINIAAIINFSGPTDSMEMIVKNFENLQRVQEKVASLLFPDATKETLNQTMSLYTPFTYLDENDPAYFLSYGGKDPIIPYNIHDKFIVAAEKLLHKKKFLFFPDAGHKLNNEEFEKAYQQIFVFLDGI